MAEPDFSGVFADVGDNGEGEQQFTVAAASQDEPETAAGGEIPAGETARDVTAPAEQQQQDTNEQKRQKDSQTKTENAKYAAARRKAERDRDRMVEEARREARGEAEKEVDQMIAGAKLVNPYTEAPIRSKADFLAWQTQYDQENSERVKEQMEEAGIAESDVKQLIENHPVVQEARASLEEIRAAREKAEAQRIRAVVDEELAKIRQWDGTVQNLTDLTATDHYQDIYEKVKRGYSLSDAYYLANREKLSQQTAAKAERSALNHVMSKDHLSGTKPRGAGDHFVPPEVMSEFRRLLPNASAEEIRRYYQKDLSHLKKQKG